MQGMQRVPECVQEVAGLLQDQLQRHACLVGSLLGRHIALLLDHGPSLDTLLRIVPLLQPMQQAQVYQSFAACFALLPSSGTLAATCSQAGLFYISSNRSHKEQHAQVHQGSAACFAMLPLPGALSSFLLCQTKHLSAICWLLPSFTVSQLDTLYCLSTLM